MCENSDGLIMKKSLKFYLLAVTAIFSASTSITSCSCSTDGSSTHVSSRVMDKDAYRLGEQHAREAIDLSGNETALQEKLLDIRARITNIRYNLGAQSAADYERGFTRYIKANSDTLTQLLLE